MTQTDNPNLVELAGRVERLSGPDREVDALMHFLCNGKWRNRLPTWPPRHIGKPAMEPGLYMYIEGDGYHYGDVVPEYTASLDAAMTLLDPRALYALGSMEEGPFARVCWPNADGTFLGSYVETAAATPALALCAAALRARAAQTHGSEE